VVIYDNGRLVNDLTGEGVRGGGLTCCGDGSWRLTGLGEGDPRLVASKRVFKSDRELRRFFFIDFAAFSSSGGGDAPMVLRRDGECV
jgi:hypothetical protein